MSARESMHLTDAQLDDYVDGAMNDAERGIAERHLTVCDQCRRAVDETRAVLAWATRERATVTAPAELWPLVGASTIHLAAVRRRVIASMRGMLVVGAIVLVAATAVVTWRVARWSMRPNVVATPASTPGHAGHAGHPVVPRAPEAPRPPEPPRP